MWKAEETVWTDKYLLLEPRYSPWRRRGNGCYQKYNNSGSYFCLCYFNLDCGCILRWRSDERKPVFTLDIQVFVLCEVYPWEVIGLCTVQQSPTDSSVCDVKPWAQIAEASILWKFWSPAPPESSSWNWDLTDPHSDQGTPAFTSLWETDYKECSLLRILLIYPFLE